MVKLADRYILRRIGAPLLAAMAIGLLVLLSERMVRLLDTTLGKKNSFSVVFELLAYLVPHYLGIAIPAALFLGLLFGFNRLSKDSEIDAFIAAGIGLHRLTWPVILLSVAIAGASLFTLGWAQPHTRYAYRSVMFNIRNVDVFYLAEEGVFMQAGTRTFMLDKLDRGQGAFDRIFLFDDRGAGGAETVAATRGILIEVPGESRPVLRLENGNRLKLDAWPDLRAKDEPRPGVAGTFKTVDTPLGRVSNKLFRPRGADERELTLPELWARRDRPPERTTVDAMRAELHKRIVNILANLMLPFLAVPFALGRRRSQSAYRFGLALIILVALHESIEQGAIATEAHGTSPWLTIWLPFGAVALFAFWRYYAACFRLTAERFDPWLDELADRLRSLRGRLARGLGWIGAS